MATMGLSQGKHLRSQTVSPLRGKNSNACSSGAVFSRLRERAAREGEAG